MSMSTNASFNEGVPIGTVLLFGGVAAPTNYVWCNGQALSRTEYAELFSVLSTRFGSGNGSTTFNVPDIRDRIPIGKTDSGAIGGKAGSKTATVSMNIPLVPHSHSVPAAGLSPAGLRDPAYDANPMVWCNTNEVSYGLYTLGKGGQYTGLTGDWHGSVGTTSSGTSSTASTTINIMPPTIAMNFIIKVK